MESRIVRSSWALRLLPQIPALGVAASLVGVTADSAVAVAAVRVSGVASVVVCAGTGHAWGCRAGGRRPRPHVWVTVDVRSDGLRAVHEVLHQYPAEVVAVCAHERSPRRAAVGDGFEHAHCVRLGRCGSANGVQHQHHVAAGELGGLWDSQDLVIEALHEEHRVGLVQRHFGPERAVSVAERHTGLSGPLDGLVGGVVRWNVRKALGGLGGNAARCNNHDGSHSDDLDDSVHGQFPSDMSGVIDAIETSCRSPSVGSPAVSSNEPRRQHYVSAMLLKQWGDTDEGRDTKIACYDMYRRTTGITTAANECVAQGMTFTDEAEQEWGQVESDAAPLLDSVRQQMQETGGEITRAIEQRLTESKNKAILCRLAALHHGRNLSVVLKTWTFAQKLGLTPEQTRQYLQDKIARRVREAEERYQGALQFVGHRESETVIGALPVYDRQALASAGWPGAPTEFIIPLSPYLSMAALAEPLRERSDEVLPVVHHDRDYTELANFEQVGVDGTNKVYFRISNSAKASELIAYLSHGGFLHWAGLRDRLEAYGSDLTAHQRAEAQARIDWFFRTSQRLKYDGPDDDGTIFPDAFQEEAKSKVWETEQLMTDLPPPEPLSRTLSYG